MQTPAYTAFVTHELPQNHEYYTVMDVKTETRRSTLHYSKDFISSKAACSFLLLYCSSKEFLDIQATIE